MANWCSPVADCAIREYPQSPWHITNKFLNEYDLNGSTAVHTGEDVNLSDQADVNEPVRAIGAGRVVFAGTGKGTWMGLVVIRHDHDNTFTCSRYGHLKDLKVKKGDIVAAGDEIGKISETDPIDHVFKPHLHFDIGATDDDLLIINPEHWPSKDLSIEERKEIVSAHYQDPRQFLRPLIAGSEGVVVPVVPREPIQPRTQQRMRVDNTFVNARTEPRTAPETFKRRLLQGDEVVVFDPPMIASNGFHWREIIEPSDLAGCWVAERVPANVDSKEVYLVRVATVVPAPTPITPPVEAPPAPEEPPTIPAPTPEVPETPISFANRVRMRVNIERLNLRTSRSINPSTLGGEVFENDELVVSNPSEVDNLNIHWREIFEPAHLRGKFVVEHLAPHVDKRLYLVQVSRTEALPDTSAPITEEPVIAVDEAGSNPASLTGRFQLSAKGPHTVLTIDGSTQPALGVNVRELAYFDTDKWPHVNADDRTIFCQEAKSMNMRWVRFFAAHADFTLDEIVAQTRTALDAIAAQNMLAIVVFADSIKNVQMYPGGDVDWHKVSDFNHLHKDYFNDGHYKTHYLPLVRRLVTEFRNHPGVGMWQLMNEPAIYPAPATDKDVDGFARFVDDTSSIIYGLDSIHPISIGIVNIAHIMPPDKDLSAFARDFYGARQHIHVVSCHAYQSMADGKEQLAWDQEDRAQSDMDAASKTGRAIFWTEFGSSQAGDRKKATERFLKRHIVDNGASGALQWGFMIGPDFAKDKGVGDSHFGMSTADFNKQYAELKQLYTHFVASLD